MKPLRKSNNGSAAGLLLVVNICGDSISDPVRPTRLIHFKRQIETQPTVNHLGVLIAQAWAGLRKYFIALYHRLDSLTIMSNTTAWSWGTGILNSGASHYAELCGKPPKGQSNSSGAEILLEICSSARKTERSKPDSGANAAVSLFISLPTGRPF